MFDINLDVTQTKVADCVSRFFINIACISLFVACGNVGWRFSTDRNMKQMTITRVKHKGSKLPKKQQKAVNENYM